MIHHEDNARETLLEYLNKPKRKIEPPAGKTSVLKKFKKDTAGSNIYIVDYDDNGVIDEEISNSIERHEDFKNFDDVQLFKDKNINDKYIVIFYVDFPAWLIKALREIGKQPSDYGFSNQKGKFHLEIREKYKKDNFIKMLVDLNKNDSSMLNILKEIFKLINHKP
jgi:hypothetical protein